MAVIELVQVILAVVVSKVFTIHQLDMKRAFLNAYFAVSGENVIRLSSILGANAAIENLLSFEKSLYGLQKAPKLCYKFLCNRLGGVGFRLSEHCECLFNGS